LGRWFFLGVKLLGVKLITYFHLVPKCEVHGVLSLRPCMPPWSVK
jgi:hypothetical protein